MSPRILLAGLATCVIAITARAAPADDLVAALNDPQLAQLASEALSRSPSIRAARARFLAAEQGPAMAAPLPDPMLRTSIADEAPAFRSDMISLEVMLSQEIPARGKRGLAVRGARLDADAASAAVETARLAVVTQVRREWLELARLDASEHAQRSQRSLLTTLQDLARARYSGGDGRNTEILRLSVERTRADMVLLELQSRREAARARLNALRDKPADVPLGRSAMPDGITPALDSSTLLIAALVTRPDLAGADAMVEAANARTDLARRAASPDVEVGGWYAAMGSGDDDLDELGFSVGLRLPMHRGRIAAGIEQASQLGQALSAEKGASVAMLRSDIASAIARLEAARQMRELSEGVLAPQAEAAVQSALAGYSAGDGHAVDVLDAGRLRRDAVMTIIDANAGAALAIIDLEGLVGTPIERVPGTGPPVPGTLASRQETAP